MGVVCLSHEHRYAKAQVFPTARLKLDVPFAGNTCRQKRLFHLNFTFIYIVRALDSGQPIKLARTSAHQCRPTNALRLPQ